MKKILLLVFSFFILGCREELPEYKAIPNITQITYHKGLDITPDIFDDGKWLAFSSNKMGNFDIYIKDVNSRDMIQRTQAKEDELFPSFSPDGKIAFSSNLFGSFDIFIMDGFSHGPIQQVTFDNASDEISPDFSPDGTKIVFSKIINNRAIICLLDLQTGLTTELTEGLFPKFSPKGNKIVYQRKIEEKKQAVWTLDLNSKLSTEIVSYDELSSLSPSWSPDGRRIVYILGKKENGLFKYKKLIPQLKDYTPIDIRIININGTEEIRLTNDRGPDGFPIWSNDNYIYFSSLRQSKDELDVNIFRLNFDGLP
ncbi:TPA: hypothetical protein DCX16_02300 [bacterium]|nr:hypothetical protein [bacterium]